MSSYYVSTFSLIVVWVKAQVWICATLVPAREVESTLIEVI